MLATLLLPVMACSKSTKDAVVGSWHEVNGTDSVSFSHDGTFNGKMISGAGEGIVSLTGNYFVEGQKASFTFPKRPDYSMTWEIKIDGDQMTVTYLQGGMIKFDGTMARFKRI